MLVISKSFGSIAENLPELLTTQPTLERFIEKLNTSFLLRGKINVEKYTGSQKDNFLVADGGNNWTVSVPFPLYDIPNAGYIGMLVKETGITFAIVGDRTMKKYKDSGVIEFHFYIDQD